MCMISVSVIFQVPGNFHVSTHSSRSQPDNPDMTHLIHKVRFGMDLQEGKVNPIEKKYTNDCLCGLS